MAKGKGIGLVIKMERSIKLYLVKIDTELEEMDQDHLME